MEDLKSRITTEDQRILRSMLEDVCENVEFILDLLTSVSGRHIEQVI